MPALPNPPPNLPKINLKCYLLLSGVSTGICLLFAAHSWEYLGIIIVYGTTLLNQWMLVEGIKISFHRAKRWKKKKIFLLYGGKLIVLFVGLALGVHFMGKRVVIPLANYLAHIFILFISFNRESSSK